MESDLSGQWIAVTDAVVFRWVSGDQGIAAKFREKSIFIRSDDWDHSERRESVKSPPSSERVADLFPSIPFIAV
ncbi:MAG TPA: hypothetical protein DDZ51_23185 [Planctomycetaceae bacterium]|nr:hypothetical protein [Planctomycetaceae bacterium]